MKSRSKYYEACCYEEMTHGVGGQSMPSECWDEPMQNSYEKNHKKFYGEDGFDWSNMEKHSR